jgi:hypothetical protein
MAIHISIAPIELSSPKPEDVYRLLNFKKKLRKKEPKIRRVFPFGRDCKIVCVNGQSLNK